LSLFQREENVQESTENSDKRKASSPLHQDNEEKRMKVDPVEVS
jgi:hypothetical protein